MNSFSPIQIQSLKNLYHTYDVSVDVMRLDLVHPVVSGNKWFKLKEYMADAKAQMKSTIITFGGAYSNHIVATAAACRDNGFRSIGIIRGEKPAHRSPTLKDAAAYGMDLCFVSRETYKNKVVPAEISEKYDTHAIYIIAEGGYGGRGSAGASSILEFATEIYTDIIASVGTGTTLAGLVTAARTNQNVMGISALKNNHGLEVEINALLSAEKQNKFCILHDYHHGGYAKQTPELISFMNWWYKQTGISSDFVYTGKLFYAVHHMITQNYFEKKRKILVIHSGGLQGNRSLKKGKLIF